MKKFKKSICILLCLALLQCSAYASITFSETPTTSEESELKWSLKIGTDYKNAPSEIAISNDFIFVMSANRLLKIDKDNGKIVQSVEMSALPSFGSAPVLCSNGKIFCPLDGGIIQAFDCESLSSLWIFDSGNDELQSLTEITESDGLLYTGFWWDEDKPANYVCINSENGDLIWSFSSDGGFYRAKCLIAGDYVLFGGDDGETDSNGTSYLRCLNKKNGEQISFHEAKGDIRCGLSFDGKNIYFATKGGYLYKFLLKNGNIEFLSRKVLDGAVTATAAICDKRIYIGVQTSGFSGKLDVINCDDLSLAYSEDMPGYPQSEALITKAYNDIYIYSTYNSAPGGVAVLKENSEHNGADLSALFTPEAKEQGYCISKIISDENGNLYYKNDSGTLFAIGKKAQNKSFFEKLSEFFVKIISFFKSIFGG